MVMVEAYAVGLPVLGPLTSSISSMKFINAPSFTLHPVRPAASWTKCTRSSPTLRAARVRRRPGSNMKANTREKGLRADR